MNESTFRGLLKQCETDTLDFKALQYDFSGADPAAKLCESIFCEGHTLHEEYSEGECPRSFLGLKPPGRIKGTQRIDRAP